MTIDEILQSVHWGYSDDYQKAKAALLADMLEIIGDDYPTDQYDKTASINANIGLAASTVMLNKRLHTIRTKLKEYFNE